MSSSNTSEYYCGREQQERVLAIACVDPRIAAIHIEMADRYADMVREANLLSRPRLRLCASA